MGRVKCREFPVGTVTAMRPGEGRDKLYPLPASDEDAYTRPLQLKFQPRSGLNKNQQLCLAVDPGSKWVGIAVISKKSVLTCGMLVLPSKVAEKLERRRVMRRARRYRKTPRRAKRFDNRRRRHGWIAPSQKAKVDFRTRIVGELRHLYPVSRFAVEDVRFNTTRNVGANTSDP